jgi:hypothetical protein
MFSMSVRKWKPRVLLYNVSSGLHSSKQSPNPGIIMSKVAEKDRLQEHQERVDIDYLIGGGGFRYSLLRSQETYVHLRSARGPGRLRLDLKNPSCFLLS